MGCVLTDFFYKILERLKVTSISQRKLWCSKLNLMARNEFDNDIVKLRQELAKIEQKFSKLSKEDANEFASCKTLLDHIESLYGQMVNVSDEIDDGSIVLRYFIFVSLFVTTNGKKKSYYFNAI